MIQNENHKLCQGKSLSPKIYLSQKSLNDKGNYNLKLKQKINEQISRGLLKSIRYNK